MNIFLKPGHHFFFLYHKVINGLEKFIRMPLPGKFINQVNHFIGITVELFHCPVKSLDRPFVARV